MYGNLKDQTKAAVTLPDPNFKRRQAILDKQRQIAERKAADHIL